MKKIIALIICIAGVLSAFGQLPEYLEFDKTLRIPTASLSVRSAEFQPLQVVTNQVMEWQTYTAYYTNSYFNPPVITVNSNAQRQVYSDVISTNPAAWTVVVVLELRNYKFDVDGDGIPGETERLRHVERIKVEPSAVIAVFGERVTGGYEDAAIAEDGFWQPKGSVRDAFLSLAAGELAGGAQ